MERYWQEYLRSGQVTIRSSVLKAVLGMVGMAVLAAFSVGIGVDGYGEAGPTSIRAWGGGIAALVCVLGMGVCVYPLIRRRRLVLDQWGFTVVSRRDGTWSADMRLPWQVIVSVERYVHNTNDGTTRVFVRVTVDAAMLSPQTARAEEGYWDLPAGFPMSKKHLVALMERVRSSPGR